MDKAKYDLLKEALLNHLKLKDVSTQNDIQKSITKDFNKSETKFEGS